MGESSRMRLCIATAEAQALLRAWFLSLRALLVKTNPGLAQANTGSVEAAAASWPQQPRWSLVGSATVQESVLSLPQPSAKLHPSDRS